MGGLQVIDDDEADDKIIAVLENDNMWHRAEDLDDIPAVLIERLQHYFNTYKLVPNEDARISIERTYGRDHAVSVVEAALEDYAEEFGQ